MDEGRVKTLEVQLTAIEGRIDGLKEALKGAKEEFDEKLIELRAEIGRRDDQQEMTFGLAGGASPATGGGNGSGRVEDAAYEDLGGQKMLPARDPLTLPDREAGA